MRMLSSFDCFMDNYGRVVSISPFFVANAMSRRLLRNNFTKSVGDSNCAVTVPTVGGQCLSLTALLYEIMSTLSVAAADEVVWLREQYFSR